MIRLRTSFLAAALFAGCSPVTDGIEPDAAVVDTTAPAIMASNPTNMASKFSVLQPVTVTFDEDLDPSTVNATTVHLTVANGQFDYYLLESDLFKPFGPGVGARQDVLATLSYDEVSRTLRLAPKAPLQWDTHYRLELTGVKDLAGNELAPTTLNFQTYINQALDERRFTTQLQPTTYVDRRLGASGRLEAHLRRTGPGADMMWFTDDDPQNGSGSSVKLEYAADGRVLKEFFYSIGPDHTYGTSDDVQEQLFLSTYDATGNLTERVLNENFGPDMMWGNEDDVIQILQAFRYDAMGRPATWIIFTDDGLVDDVWRTADDSCAFLMNAEYDQAGRRSREAFKGCGPDELPATADDVFAYYWEHKYDANNVPIARWMRNGPGGNTMWLDDDDEFSRIEKYDVDANGLVTASYNYGGPGIDGVWNSGVDQLDSYTRTTYNENGQAILVAEYAPGMDTMLGTPDDPISAYTRTEYDTAGNRTGARYYDAGPDTVAFTGDDRMLAEHFFDTTY